MLVALVAGCTGGDDGSTAAEVAELLEPEVALVELSEGVTGYYGELFFDAEHLLVGELAHGRRVLLLDRPAGYGPDDAEEVEAAAADLAAARSATMLAHRGVAVVVLSDDAGDLQAIEDALDR